MEEPEDISDSIQFIAHLTNFLPDTFTIDDTESHLKVFYDNLLQHSDDTALLTICIQYLNETNQYSTITLKDISNSNDTHFQIHIKNPWLFQVLLVSTIKHIKSFKNFHIEQLQELTKHIINNLDPNRLQTVLLLKVLQLVLKKRPDVLKSNLNYSLLYAMHKLSISSYLILKYQSQNITKILLKILPLEETKVIFSSLTLLPVRGFESSSVINLFTTQEIRNIRSILICKVNKLFLNNIENRDGSFIYQALINNCDFEEFSMEICPYFRSQFQELEYEGEYFQSLLKYWIPCNVKKYKSNFYLLVKNEKTTDYTLKAYILLEIKKRGFYLDLFDTDALQFLLNINTFPLGLKILCYFVKSSDKIQIDPIFHIFTNYSVKNITNHEDSLQNYFAHIFYTAHKLIKRKEDTRYLENFLTNIFNFCYNYCDKERSEITLVLLRIIHSSGTCSSKNLKLTYSVEKPYFYENEENLFYIYLKQTSQWTFDDTNFVQKILNNCNVYNKNTTSLISACLVGNFVVNDLDDVVTSMSKNPCLQNSEKIRNYSVLLFKFRTNVLENLIQNLSQYLNSFDQRDEISLFKIVLYQEVLLVGLKSNEQNIDNIIIILLKITKNLIQCKWNSNKAIKIVEAFINNTMHLMIHSKCHWTPKEFQQILTQLYNIIQNSNLRKPVSLAVEVLKYFWITFKTDTFYNIKIKFLESTLKLLHETPQCLNVKIRRNPESRLVLHSICVAENYPTKPFLQRIMQFLIDLISDSNSSDASVTSSLHCLEMLVADNTLQHHTFNYTTKIIKVCVEHFDQQSWSVKNGDLQLIKALIERFFGVSLSHFHRPKNIEDLFLLFPELSTFFYKSLMHSKSVLIFQFFLQSQIKPQLFPNKFLDICRDSFLRLLVDKLKVSQTSERHAENSFISLCSVDKIEIIFSDLVDYVISNIAVLPKNNLASHMYLIKMLYLKSDTKGKLKAKVESLFKILQDSEDSQSITIFDYLLIKVRTVDDILKDLKLYKNINNYESRLWYHNNLSFVVAKVKTDEIDIVLKLIFDQPNLPNCIEVKLLSIVIQRLNNHNFTLPTLNNLIRLFYERMMIISDKNTYLLNCYFNVILLLFESTNKNINLKLDLQKYYSTENIHKIMVLILLLSDGCQCKDQLDFDFINAALKQYTKNVMLNEEIAYEISTTLLFLYKCIPTISRPTVFKLVFYLLLSESDNTKYEMCYFVSQVFQIQIADHFNAMKILLNFSNLNECLLQDNVVLKFLLDIKQFVEGTSDCYENERTFYLVQNELSVSKQALLEIVETSLNCFYVEDEKFNKKEN